MPANKSQSHDPKREDFVISSTFTRVAIRLIDDRSRVNLGQDLVQRIGNAESLELLVDEDGNILLRPMSLIPTNELWIWRDRDVRQSFRRASRDIQQGDFIEVDTIEGHIDSL